MTIQDAINRAKRMQQGRQQERQVERDASTDRAPERPVDLVSPGAGEIRRVPAVSFEPLQTIEISEAACREHRVIVSEDDRRQAPQADAAYRLIRSKVGRRMQRDNWTSFAVSSPRQGDGKTVTTLNLALSIAREKQRPVYVLDLDMRNPSVCEYLGVKGLRPLTEYFAGNAQPADVLYQTTIPYFFIAGSHERVDGASEMLSGPRLEELVQHIRLRSPDAIVIMDLPPVNVTDEALVVAPRVDAMVVVVAEGKTQREDLSRTLSALSEFTIAGVVVNRSSDQHAGYYGRYAG